MSETLSLQSTVCGICGTEGNATEVYAANFRPEALNVDVFSARRLPDRIHYRLVRCNQCELLRSDPVAAPDLIAKLYAASHFDYGSEVDNLKRTYGSYLKRLGTYAKGRGAVLEIGCGNGFVLEEALDQGYTVVRGVEPSAHAISKADPRVRGGIVEDIFRPGLFAPDTFDAVCMFQVLDHLPDPRQAVAESFRVLKPGGALLCFNHNIEALSARILGERSPIIDIEHTYLYSPITMRRLLEPHGFQVREVGAAWNQYSLHYLTHLLPLPRGIKASLLSMLSKQSIGRTRLSVALGNLYVIAQKPE